MAYDDVYRIVASKSIATVGTSGAAAASSTAAFGSTTHAIDIVFVGAITTSSGVRFSICDVASVTVNSTTSPLLPPNWIYRCKVSAGQVVAALSNDATAVAGLTVYELAT